MKKLLQYSAAYAIFATWYLIGRFYKLLSFIPGCGWPLRRHQILTHGMIATIEESGMTCVYSPKDNLHVFFPTNSEDKNSLNWSINANQENMNVVEDKVSVGKFSFWGGFQISARSKNLPAIVAASQMHKVLYEGVMHGEFPRYISNISLGGILPGVKIIDT